MVPAPVTDEARADVGGPVVVLDEDVSLVPGLGQSTGEEELAPEPREQVSGGAENSLAVRDTEILPRVGGGDERYEMIVSLELRDPPILIGLIAAATAGTWENIICNLS